MSKVARFLAATTLAFGSLLLATPARAEEWVASNALLQDGSVQFNWQGGSATQILTVAEGSTLSLTVNNTIANRIGWGQPLPDSWTVTINGQTFTGNEVDTTTISLEVSGEVIIQVSGIDRGFWAGWYGPIFSAPVVSSPVIPSQPVSEEVVRPEPTPEPSWTPEPSPQPSPEFIPTPAPQPAPEPAPEPIPEPIPTPEPVAPTPPPVAPEPPQPAPEVITPPPPAPPVVEPPAEPVLPPEPVLPVEEEIAQELTALAEEAKADDPVVPQELASIPLFGNAAVAVLEAFNALGNIGADIRPEIRKTAQQAVVSSVIVGQIATTASLSMGASYRRNK